MNSWTTLQSQLKQQKAIDTFWSNSMVTWNYKQRFHVCRQKTQKTASLKWRDRWSCNIWHKDPSPVLSPSSRSTASCWRTSMWWQADQRTCQYESDGCMRSPESHPSYCLWIWNTNKRITSQIINQKWHLHVQNKYVTSCLCIIPTYYMHCTWQCSSWYRTLAATARPG